MWCAIEQPCNRVLQCDSVLWWNDPACIAHEPCRITDSRHHARHSTGHRFANSIGNPLAIRTTADADIQGIVNVRHVCAASDPQEPFFQSQIRRDVSESGSIVIRSVPDTYKTHMLPFLHQEGSRLQKNRVILHGIESPHKTDELFPVIDAPLQPYPIACARIRTESFCVDSVGDDHTSVGRISKWDMVFTPGVRIQNDG